MENNGNVVAKEVAEKDVNKWLDYKKVDPGKREEFSDNIDNLVNAISAGHLVYKNNELVQTLKFPVGKDDAVKVLKYKARIKMSEIEARSQNIKGSSHHGILRAYICALTETHSDIIKELDTEDNRIAQSIATFFL